MINPRDILQTKEIKEHPVNQTLCRTIARLTKMLSELWMVEALPSRYLVEEQINALDAS